MAQSDTTHESVLVSSDATSAVKSKASKKTKITAATKVVAKQRARPRKVSPSADVAAAQEARLTEGAIQEPESPTGTEANLPSPKKGMDGITSDIYRAAAQRIVQALDAGTSIWQKPWVAPPGQSLPHNASTGLPYVGINRVTLMCEMLAHDWRDARFMSYRQVQAFAAGLAKQGVEAKDLPHVKAGAKGLTIYKLGFVEKKNPVLDPAGRPRLDAEGKPIVNVVRGRSFLRTYVVFPSAAIANMPPLPEVEPRPQWEVDSRIEDLIEKMGVPVHYRVGGRAFYSIASDSVTLPERSQFQDTRNEDGVVTESARSKHNSVLLHELAHASGAAHRLSRPMSGVHGSESYSVEELVAETASFYLQTQLFGAFVGIDEASGVEQSSVSLDALNRAAAYLDSWRALAVSDPKALFKAFSEATHAADWVLGRHPKQLQMAAQLVNDGPSVRLGVGADVAPIQRQVAWVAVPDAPWLNQSAAPSRGDMGFAGLS